MSIVYISGPMAGYDGLNEVAFRAAAQTILDRGDAPLVPHDIKPHWHPGRECAPVYGSEAAEGGHDGGCYLRADLADMLKVADSLYLLPGWSRSRGAQIEVLIARLLHMSIEYHPDAERGGSSVYLLAEVCAEMGRQNAKWGQQNHPDGTGEHHRLWADICRDGCQAAFAEGRGTWRHVLQEEVAEAHAETGDALHAELIQVAAVATQWAAAIERRAS